ncbi:MAG: heavy metal translocating P-type ATPase [Candidatus Eisenbacteria bacterium]|nr:heavy metal translocating P-type ATPase [Candidatus Eisenbacteria bacterium]
MKGGKSRATSAPPPEAPAPEAGPEELMRARLAVRGMSCANCARAVEKALRSVPGVAGAVVNAAAEAASVRYDPARAGVEDLLEAVKRAGYRAVPADEAEEGNPTDERMRLLGVAALALPILLIHQGAASVPRAPWVMLALATILQFTGGLRFYRGAFRSMRVGFAGMDVLVALGITAAWGYSALLVLFPDLSPGERPFFETAAMLILFIRFGRYLEARAKGRAGDAMRALLRRRPDRALLVDAGGEREVDAAELAVGNRVRARAGERVAVDGVIEEGEAAVDEAYVTGESVPVWHRPGEEVTGGTLVLEGNLVLRAVAVGDATFLARVVRMTEEAQLDRAPIQRYADRVSHRFVPAVVAVAAIAFLVWLVALGAGASFSLSRAVAVLAVACPCALGLATPTAILVGSGVALGRGVLFKRGSALEAIARVRTVLFDKTGTITRGVPSLTDILPAEGTNEKDVLALAASAAAVSTHPLSLAIVRRAAAEGTAGEPARQGMELAGRGIRFAVDGGRGLLGSERLLREEGIDPGALAAEAARLEREGKTTLWLAVDDAARALFAFRDEPKDRAVDAIARIRAMGISTGLVTGDRRATAEAIGSRIGVGRVWAEVLPEGKAEIVEEARREAGGPVAMVGDGINDAPALARADVGIAIGAGTDVAKEAGDVVLVHGDPADAAVAVELGRAVLRKIRINLFWALLYNVLMIPFAAGLFARWGLLLPPEIAGLAMALSSVSVVLNSIDLKRWRPVGD